ncbi:hypothetical protein Plim_2890 [Planctopirus limnophila DSM 3776]|uniref:Uncharacterized protein n=1 Tax=Planctopirus limnophila (strain ATCC 43296 / DSM 3776 / IFAM 1008 / Mu 290) TaxID=521674 RepID=D5SRY8_PLAL2|nr:hypothetical protein [Planctopirus limnophila]ADG68712.1 hypothetical protein Plim_2890 [Planctopirus limnophila DSM 3776]
MSNKQLSLGVWLCVLSMLCVCTQTTVACADQKSRANSRDEKRENEAVKEARQDLDKAKDRLKDEEKQLRAARADFQKAEQERKQAASALQKLREQMEEKYEQETGLQAARQNLKQLTIERDRVLGPIVQAIRQRETGLSAGLKQAEEKLSRATTLDERKGAAKQIAEYQAQFRQLEATAIEADPRAKELSRKVALQEQQVQSANQKLDRIIERDNQLKAAEQKFAASRKAEDVAEQAVSKASRDVAQAQASVDRAEKQLAQKVAQDRKDKNRK